MKIIKASNYDEMSKKAAQVIAAQITLKGDSVLGLATGSSPEGTYKYLIDWYNQGDLDFSGITSVNLDEYVGLTADHDQSYAYFMRKHLFDHVNIDLANTNIPCGIAEDPAAECSNYDAKIKSLGGVDLQLLGIGPNGPSTPTSVSSLPGMMFPARRSPWASVTSCRLRGSFW